MLVHDSALKHGIDPDDAIYAAEHAVYRADETEEPPVAEFRLGFDPHGRLLELTVLVFDSGNEGQVPGSGVTTDPSKIG